jgi:nucleoside-diphosphate-sugar epimerase
MRIFLAGASGAVGRRLTPLLLRAGHHITGTTRSAETGKALAKAGVEPAVLDVLDGAAVSAALVAAPRKRHRPTHRPAETIRRGEDR